MYPLKHSVKFPTLRQNISIFLQIIHRSMKIIVIDNCGHRALFHPTLHKISSKLYLSFSSLYMSCLCQYSRTSKPYFYFRSLHKKSIWNNTFLFEFNKAIVWYKINRRRTRKLFCDHDSIDFKLPKKKEKQNVLK